MSDTERRPPLSEDELLHLLAKHHAPVTPPEEFERRLRGELEAEFRRLAREDDSAQPPVDLHERPAQRLTTEPKRRRRTAWISVAAAACILVGLSALWLCSHREETHKATTGMTALRPTVTAPPGALSVDDLPSTEAGFLRAFLQSPQTLDSLLAQKERTRFHSTQVITELNGWRLLETMDNDKEKHNDTRNTGRRLDGAIA